MNKLIIAMVTLCSVVSVVAMEERALLPITKEESDRFVSHSQMATNYSNKAVNDNRITPINALHIITNHCAELLKYAKNDLAEMIKNQDLHGRLEEFKKFELDEKIITAKKTLLNESSDKLLFADIKKELSDRRKEFAALHLEAKQPSYQKPVVGEVQSDARINFMDRNRLYPLNDVAIKDYIATLIYQYILANRVVIYDESK